MSQKIILYGTPICPMVPPVRGMLERSQADFEYINIHQDSDGRERVRQINNGNESVPTLVFSDGSTLTEPSTEELKGKLEALGYQVTPPTARQALRENPIISLLGLLFLLMGFFNGNRWLIGFGIVLLLYSIFKDRV
jgi:mycoredoxin